MSDAEQRRLAQDAEGSADWRRFGPYLAERQWGTVREDYSEHGDAWSFFPFAHAHARAYRWGEDGLAGFSDLRQYVCLSLALWNGRDPILKERLFGLTNAEGNHGEDVKELYWYLDATPSHAYDRLRYLYPQTAFPYDELREGNARRGQHEPELELEDTGVLDAGVFVVDVEYAKAAPDDVLMRVTVENRGPETATVHVLPQVWFRNTWSWDGSRERPELRADGARRLALRHARLPALAWEADQGELLVTENETNLPRLFGVEAPGPFKDAFHDRVVHGDEGAVAADGRGTKAAAHVVLELAPGESRVVRARLAPRLPGTWDGFDAVVAERRAEADAFYASLQAGIADADARLVQRQALAGMLWSTQFYALDVERWLEGDPLQPPPPETRRNGRNRDWRHLDNADVISMPDTWEYPWYAAWDLAFHCIPLALVDPELAKHQLTLLTREWFMHPNGQLPAYEWSFGDVNPPVHAWAAWRVFQIDRARRGGEGDRVFLERVFHKLLLNFTWWVNRKDAHGRNVFQGGFLGLDNIGVFDRSAPLPTGGHINQADATAWMGMYSLNLLRIALELAQSNRAYEHIATKFFEHFLAIAKAMTSLGGDGVGLWDEEDEFFYDVLDLGEMGHVPLKVRSIVGLIPLFAVEVIEHEQLERLPEFRRRLEWYLENRPDLAALVSRWHEPGQGERHLLSLLRGHRMKCLLRRMLDESEFLSPYGVRALSRVHEAQPYVFELDGMRLEVGYEPGESTTRIFGGNSNWRGPVWFPVNYLLIESLQKFHHYYSDDFRVECPAGSGTLLSLAEIADALAGRLVSLFLRGPDGVRPALGPGAPFADDCVLFHEYFHADTGRGLGASHQTGWTGLVAKLLQPRRMPGSGDRADLDARLDSRR